LEAKISNILVKLLHRMGSAQICNQVARKL